MSKRVFHNISYKNNWGKVKYKQYYLIPLFLILANFSFPQENNIWVFGSQGSLDFNYTPPQILNPPPAVMTKGNCSSVCDSMGKLLFYSDETTVYGADHTVFKNGIGIKGVAFTSQSELLLPSVSHYRRYFLFSIQYYYEVSDHGLYYSVIDEGKKEVVSKNNLISKDTFFYLTAIRHANEEDIWIISRKYPDTFFVWLFSNDSLHLPKKYHITNKYNSDNHLSSHETIGASHDGRTLIITGGYPTPIEVNGYNYVESFDFDKNKGEISNKKILLEYDGQSYYSPDYRGFAFSANDSIIYLITSNIRDNKLIQIDRNSKSIKYFDRSINSYTIKTGPDGKVYLLNPHKKTVSVIHNPDKWGSSCNLQENVLLISNIGIPGNWAFPNNFFQLLRISFESDLNCNVEFNMVNKSDTDIFKIFTWYFPNGDTAVGLHQYYDFGKSGRYFVSLKGQKEYGYTQWTSDTVTFLRKPNANFYADTTIGCQWVGYQFYDSSFADTLNIDIGESWLWEFGDGTTDTIQNPSHIYTQTGEYTIKLVYSNGFCSDTIEKDQAVEIIEAPRPGFQMSEINYCSPYTLQITDTSLGKVQSWFYSFGDGSYDTLKSPAHLYANQGNYKIIQTLVGPTGCITKDSAFLHLRKGFSEADKINSLSSHTIENKSILINWHSLTDAFSYNLFKSENDINYLKITNQIDTFYLDMDVDPTIMLYAYKITGLDSCNRTTTESLKLKNILLTGESFSNEYSILRWTPFEQWQNGVETYWLQYENNDGQFEMVTSTTTLNYDDSRFFDGKTEKEKCYRIVGIEKDGNRQQSTSNLLCLEYEPVLWIRTAFTPNGDGLNDTFIVKGIRIEDFQIQIFNQWGEKVFENNNANLGWDGKFRGQLSSMGVYTYYIKSIGMDGENISVSGTLHLIR